MSSQNLSTAQENNLSTAQENMRQTIEAREKGANNEEGWQKQDAEALILYAEEGNCPYFIQELEDKLIDVYGVKLFMEKHKSTLQNCLIQSAAPEIPTEGEGHIEIFRYILEREFPTPVFSPETIETIETIRKIIEKCITNNSFKEIPYLLNYREYESNQIFDEETLLSVFTHIHRNNKESPEKAWEIISNILLVSNPGKIHENLINDQLIEYTKWIISQTPDKNINQDTMFGLFLTKHNAEPNLNFAKEGEGEKSLLQHCFEHSPKRSSKLFLMAIFDRRTQESAEEEKEEEKEEDRCSKGKNYLLLEYALNLNIKLNKPNLTFIEASLLSDLEQENFNLFGNMKDRHTLIKEVTNGFFFIPGEDSQNKFDLFIELFDKVSDDLVIKIRENTKDPKTKNGNGFEVRKDMLRIALQELVLHKNEATINLEYLFETLKQKSISNGYGLSSYEYNYGHTLLTLAFIGDGETNNLLFTKLLEDEDLILSTYDKLFSSHQNNNDMGASLPLSSVPVSSDTPKVRSISDLMLLLEQNHPCVIQRKEELMALLAEQDQDQEQDQEKENTDKERYKYQSLIDISESTEDPNNKAIETLLKWFRASPSPEGKKHPAQPDEDEGGEGREDETGRDSPAPTTTPWREKLSNLFGSKTNSKSSGSQPDSNASGYFKDMEEYRNKTRVQEVSKEGFTPHDEL